MFLPAIIVLIIVLITEKTKDDKDNSNDCQAQSCRVHPDLETPGLLRVLRAGLTDKYKQYYQVTALLLSSGLVWSGNINK